MLLIHKMMVFLSVLKLLLLLKINVDASFIEDTGDATIGIIARDHLGQISMAASLVIDKCSDAEEAEACAIREGLNLSLEHNLKPVAVESDCAVAVAAANRREAVASRCWGVYKDIQALRKLNPDVTKISRNCNSVAHELAKLAMFFGDSYVWLPPIPDSIVALCVKYSDPNLVITPKKEKNSEICRLGCRCMTGSPNYERTDSTIIARHDDDVRPTVAPKSPSLHTTTMPAVSSTLSPRGPRRVATVARP
jgi:ribonuclease HI